MINIQVDSTRVQKVQFVCKSEMEEDQDLIVWKFIRPLVDKIDRKLKQSAEGSQKWAGGQRRK